MPDSIELYAETIDSIEAIDNNTILVELVGVKIDNVIQEIGYIELLDAIGTDKIEKYLKGDGDVE